MTVHTAHPSLQVTPKTAGLALAGALLAVATGFAVFNAIDDTSVPVTPDSGVSQIAPPSGARDSWEGRIGPAADGVRDSWMPPGTTDREQGGLRHGR